jgi:hypothetical protein
MPRTICECGCGELAKYGNKFIHGHNSHNFWSHPTFNGGKKMGGKNQKRPMTRVIGHPRGDWQGYVFNSILVMEIALKRHILLHEVVHHIDEDCANNDIGNLILFKTVGGHQAYHARLRAFKACGHWDWIRCGYCSMYDSPDNMYIRPNGYGFHRRCREARRTDRVNPIVISGI